MNALTQNDPGQVANQLWLDSHLNPLRSLARSIFLDRNAQGAPQLDRLKIKAGTRPHLREAIGHVRKSRDALRRNNMAVCDLERERARTCWAFARSEFFRPYANQVGRRHRQNAKIASKGGKARAQHNYTEIDKLIGAFLERNERMPIKEWMEVYVIPKTTLYERIRRIRHIRSSG